MNSDPQKNYDKKGLSSVDVNFSFTPKDQKTENIVIHTMKKDLQNINNPQYFNAPDNIDFSEPTKPPLSPATPDSKQRTSPFLSQNVRQETGLAPAISSENRQKNISPAPMPHTPSSWGKLILITCIIFLLFAAGAGGYYFWMNKKSIVVKTPESTVVVPQKPTLSLDKPNYLNIDTSTEKIDLASVIDKYIKEVDEERPTTPVEFMVVDNQNNPVTLNAFLTKCDISLAPDITSNLKDNFSLFIYLDEGQPHVGLAIDSNDLIGTGLKEALANNEPGIVSMMKPIYLSGSSISNDDTFNTSYYGGAEIRFKNIDSVSGLSLDYTIFRDKLTIGTSKMTLRSIIDYLTANGKVKGVENVIENIPEEDLQNGKI